MAKVTFEFDEFEDRDDINVIVNRHKLLNALYELSNYRRGLYKGYEPGTIVVKDNKVVYRDNKKLEDYELEGSESFIGDELVIQKIDTILNDVYDLIN